MYVCLCNKWLAACAALPLLLLLSLLLWQVSTSRIGHTLSVQLICFHGVVANDIRANNANVTGLQATCGTSAIEVELFVVRSGFFATPPQARGWKNRDFPNWKHYSCGINSLKRHCSCDQQVAPT